MKTVLCLLLAFACVFAYKNSDEFINEINSKQSLWKAGRNFDEDTPWSTIKGLLGAKSLPKELKENIPVVRYDNNEGDDIPESFDARTHWPNCKIIGNIPDQSSCGSCWAVSVASSISDRICIGSGGKLQPQISASNLMSCSPSSQGCQGGLTFSAFQYWKVDGLVTGGEYGSKIGCQPYPFAQCEHHTDNNAKPKCPSKVYATPECVKRCDNSSLNFYSELSYGKSAYALSTDEKDIQMDIMEHGTVVAGFNVYSDFLHYKSGVYFKTSGEYEGGHAVRIIGWGVENGTKYWLIANSWNEDWGDRGLFKIRRGVNECKFEDEICAGLPKL